MKKKSGLSKNPVAKTNIFGFLWRCLKGAWGSFSRLIKRSLNPSTGKRQVAGVTRTRTSQHRSVPLHVSPLVGVPKSHNVESLTVVQLFATVRWNDSTQASAPATVASVKDQISWD
jgi:hypothetical protein